MSRIDERLEVMGIDTSGMTAEEKFTAATGLTRYDSDMAANDWYVPAGAANTLSTSSEPTGVEPTGVEPTGTEPTGVEPTGTEPTGVEPTGTEPTGVEPTGAEPTGVEPTGTEPTGVEPTGTEPTGVEPTGTEPTGVEPTGVEPTGEETNPSTVDVETPIRGEQLVFAEQPTAESIIEQLGNNPIKPVDPQTLNMNSLTTQTSMYLAFPASWLIFDENENLVKPKITNSLGFELGYEITDTIEVNGIEYGIFSIQFGKDTFTIVF